LQMREGLAPRPAVMSRRRYLTRQPPAKASNQEPGDDAQHGQPVDRDSRQGSEFVACVVKPHLSRQIPQNLGVFRYSSASVGRGAPLIMWNSPGFDPARKRRQRVQVPVELDRHSPVQVCTCRRGPSDDGRRDRLGRSIARRPREDCAGRKSASPKNRTARAISSGLPRRSRCGAPDRLRGRSIVILGQQHRTRQTQLTCTSSASARVIWINPALDTR
jgi:hypothetical protein